MATVFPTPTLSQIAAMMTRRWNKALRLTAEGRVHETNTPNVFRVEGESGEWLADLNTNACTCPDHEHRKCFCAHLFAGVIFSGHLMALQITEELAAIRVAGSLSLAAA